MNVFTRQSALNSISAAFPLAACIAFAIVVILIPFRFGPVISIYHALRLLVLFWFSRFVNNESLSAGWIVIPLTIQPVSRAILARKAGASV